MRRPFIDYVTALSKSSTKMKEFEKDPDAAGQKAGLTPQQIGALKKREAKSINDLMKQEALVCGGGIKKITQIIPEHWNVK